MFLCPPSCFDNRFFRRIVPFAGLVRSCAGRAVGRRGVINHRNALCLGDWSPKSVWGTGEAALALPIRPLQLPLLQIQQRYRFAQSPAFYEEEGIGLCILTHEPLKLLNELPGLPRQGLLNRTLAFASFSYPPTSGATHMDLVLHPLPQFTDTWLDRIQRLKLLLWIHLCSSIIGSHTELFYPLEPPGTTG